MSVYQNIEKLVAATPPVRIRLGAMNYFPASDDAPYDVLYVEVDSPQLHLLNQALAKLPHTDTHEGYVPHLTICYLKPGKGAQYAGDMRFAGQEFVTDELIYSDPHGKREVVRLGGVKCLERNGSINGFLKSGQWDEGKHPRAEDGKFGQGGAAATTGAQARKKERRRSANRSTTSTDSSTKVEGEAKPVKSRMAAKQLLAKAVGISWETLKELGHKAVDVEHAAKEWATIVASGAMEKLPGPIAKIVQGLWTALRFGIKTAFITYTAGQKVAEEVAKAKGASDQEASQLRSILSAIDTATCKPVSIGLSAMGLGAVAIPASMIPIGSMTYLAYSTAKNPMATMRAAREAVRSVKGLVSREKNHEAVERLLEAIKAHGASDEFMALVLVALDETGSLQEAIVLASKAAESRTDDKPTKKSFDESKHPRGQPENAGQFGSGGGGGSKESAKDAVERETANRTPWETREDGRQERRDAASEALEHSGAYDHFDHELTEADKEAFVDNTDADIPAMVEGKRKHLQEYFAETANQAKAAGATEKELAALQKEVAKAIPPIVKAESTYLAKYEKLTALRKELAELEEPQEPEHDDFAEPATADIDEKIKAREKEHEEAIANWRSKNPDPFPEIANRIAAHEQAMDVAYREWCKANPSKPLSEGPPRPHATVANGDGTFRWDAERDPKWKALHQERWQAFEDKYGDEAQAKIDEADEAISAWEETEPELNTDDLEEERQAKIDAAQEAHDAAGEEMSAAHEKAMGKHEQAVEKLESKVEKATDDFSGAWDNLSEAYDGAAFSINAKVEAITESIEARIEEEADADPEPDEPDEEEEEEPEEEDDTTAKNFDPAKHPRGQPHNSGQFASGHGSSAPSPAGESDKPTGAVPHPRIPPHLVEQAPELAKLSDAAMAARASWMAAVDTNQFAKMGPLGKAKNAATAERDKHLGPFRDELLTSLLAKSPHIIKTNVSGLKGEMSATLQHTAAMLSGLLERREGDGDIREIVGRHTANRASYDNANGVLSFKSSDPPSVVAHELGHAIEDNVPGVREAAQEFLASRVGDEQPVSLAEKFPGHGYGASEKGMKDQFGGAMDERAAYYTGKTYPDGSTEIISTGLEMLIEDPARFMARDPGYFSFIVSVLDGSGRK